MLESSNIFGESIAPIETINSRREYTNMLQWDLRGRSKRIFRAVEIGFEVTMGKYTKFNTFNPIPHVLLPMASNNH